jgi:predicted GH43/DUF377 family glycosyl hydrolase
MQRRTPFMIAAMMIAGVALVMAASQPVTITAERVSDSPLLNDGPEWASFGIFNPGAIAINNRTILLFRAQDRNHTSRIGYAESTDGIHFNVRPEPLLSPEAGYEQGGGLEDPRILKIGKTYYLTYTGYDLRSAQLCLATGTDLIHWQRRGVILPAYKGTWNTQWTKSGAIVGEKIDGKWWMYYLGTRTDADGKARDYMGVASSNDLLHWTDATDKPVLDRRPAAFDSRVMEPGPPPFLTSRGILLLYNGADEHLVYRPGWVLFDRHDPRRVIARADKPFAAPTLDWEKTGNVPNVIFLEGATLRATTESHGLQLVGYYGAADKRIGALNIRIDFPAK